MSRLRLANGTLVLNHLLAPRTDKEWRQGRAVLVVGQPKGLLQQRAVGLGVRVDIPLLSVDIR
jgi:hypothetical protein